MIQLDQLTEHLNRIEPNDWNKLFGLIPEIEATETFGEVRGGDTLPDGSIAMPYWSSAKIVDKFLHAVNDLDVVPVYNWTSWKEGKSLLDDNSTDYNTLPIETLCKLLTIIIRADRFSDGYLVGMFANGKMLKIIKAIKGNRDQYLLLREQR
ncbi:hypothetical protein GCM10028806_50960 [Spirosoma terrae]|uniref:Uncharacterized protein n=1 Tax=Spirosoma terrae TaxID=1968276 RepID=A0A6L9LIM5_9BACT|nr:DUF6508 domain-containing protein [Spirosoma terrae]NDU96449.1 hypothetical protein [Spirosoma terrae]